MIQRKTEYKRFGKLYQYDACTSGYGLFKSIFMTYNLLKYRLVWMSKTYYIDGVENKTNKRHYFFVK